MYSGTVGACTRMCAATTTVTTTIRANRSTEALTDPKSHEMICIRHGHTHTPTTHADGDTIQLLHVKTGKFLSYPTATTTKCHICEYRVVVSVVKLKQGPGILFPVIPTLTLSGTMPER